MASLPEAAKRELNTTSPRQFWIAVIDFFEGARFDVIILHLINLTVMIYLVMDHLKSP